MSKKDVLIYVGGHHGYGLQPHFKNYNRVFVFEADPNLCKSIKSNYSNHNHVFVVNAAVCESHNSKIKFRISQNGGGSSSILKPNPKHSLINWIATTSEIEVSTVNLLNFCLENNINYIDSYISDAQGYDFKILKTLKNYISEQKIGEIQCEVLFDGKEPIYIMEEQEDQNTESNFSKLLSGQYIKIAEGWSELTNGVFNEVPEDWSEHDVKWISKKIHVTEKLYS